MKFILFIFMSLALTITKADKLSFEINGYIYILPSLQTYPESYSLISGNETDENVFFANISRLRLRPTLSYGMNTEITAHYEINSLWSEIAIPFPEAKGIGIRQAIDLNQELVSQDKIKVNHYIDRLYLKQFFDFGEISIGRQRISWGVGRIWQLTDLFNPINPANFSKFEKDGADALSAKIYKNNFSDIEMVVNIRETTSQYNYGWRYRTNFNEYDVSAVGGYFDNNYIIGTEFAGNLMDAGVRGEFVFSAKDNNFNSNYYQLLLGIDYQFNEKLYALVEYKHNGRGTECKLCYDLIALFEGKILNVGLDYIATQATYQIHPLISTNLMNISNIRDKSGFFNAGLTYNAMQNLHLSISGMYFYGKELTEYWYYSSAGLLTFEWYF